MKYRLRFVSQVLGACLAAFVCVSAVYAGGSGDKRSDMSSYFGEWEVTRVLMTAGMQPQWSMRENDMRLLGRRLWIGPDHLVFRSSSESDRREECKLQPPTKSSANAPTRNLFTGSLRGGAEAKVIGNYIGRLYGREKNYEHESLRAASVTLMRIICKEKDHPWTQGHNWIAKPNGAKEVLLWAHAPDALMVFERPQKDKPIAFEQKALCDQATSQSEKAICANEQLRTLDRFIRQMPLDYAKTASEAVNAARKKNIASLIEKRAACNGDLVCLYDVLDKHITTLVQWQ